MIFARLPHRVAGPARQWKPDIYRPRRKHLRRHHANNGERLIAQVHRLAEHVRVAVPHPLPNLVADHAHRGTAHTIFFLGEHAPELRLQADDFEKASGHQTARHLFRGAAFQSTQVVGFPAGDRDIFKNGIVAFPIDVVRIGDGNLGQVRVCLRQDHDPIAVGIWERLEEDRVDDTEDRGVRANAEREGEDGDESEARRFPQLTQSEAQVVHGARRFISQPLPARSA